jgi:hypothetical protein
MTCVNLISSTLNTCFMAGFGRIMRPSDGSCSSWALTYAQLPRGHDTPLVLAPHLWSEPTEPPAETHNSLTAAGRDSADLPSRPCSGAESL